MAKEEYLGNVGEIKNADERIQLDAVYKCLNEILTYSCIKEQLDAIKESHMNMMHDNECVVSSKYPQMDRFL